MMTYEVTLTAHKTFCVKAKNEIEAQELVMEQSTGDFEPVEASVQYRLDEQKDQKIIAEYKNEGNYLEAE